MANALHLKGVKILVVDDDVASCKLIEAALSSEGCETVSVASSEEALVLLPELKPHLVLADLRLPLMTGIELTKLIKSRPETRDTVVVLISSRNGRDTSDDAMAAGCAAVWRKPIDVLAMPQLLAALLED